MTMLMFQVCTAFGVSLIALAISMGVVVFMKIHKDHTTQFCRGVAYVVIVLALLTVICVGYYATKYWFMGYAGSHQMMKTPGKCMMMNNQGMQNGQMQGKSMMMQNQGMQKMQNGQMQGNQQMMKPMMNKQPMQNSTMKPGSKKMSSSADDHNTHHPKKVS